MEGTGAREIVNDNRFCFKEKQRVRQQMKEDWKIDTAAAF